MKLRARVALSFLLASSPAVFLAGGAVVILDRLVEQQITERRVETADATRKLLEDQASEAHQRLRALAESDLLREAAQAVDSGDLSPFEDLAGNRAQGAGLELLAVVAARGPEVGRVISSAHLPRAVGDRAPEFVAGSVDQVGLVHEFVDGQPPRVVPALVAVQVVRHNNQPALYLYGGLRLDGHRLESVARMARATLTVASPGLPPLVFGPGGDLAALGSVPLHSLPKGRLLPKPATESEPSQILLQVHPTPLEAARKLFLSLALVLAVAALLAALAVSALLSRRITLPILALAEAARAVAQGNLEVQVKSTSKDEVGGLVEIFNRMTKELAEARLKLQRAERLAAWREIARRVAHEIKNPLFPIQMSVETLRKSYQKKHPALDQIVDESTRTVLEEVRALNRIVTEFSDFARLPAPQKQPTPVAGLLEHVARLYESDGRVRWDKTAIEGRQLTLMADPEQLQRALINLVKNALEALPEGQGAVTLDATHTEGAVVISVADTGSGIPEAVQAQLFTPYFTTKTQGTGLGLAIVERIVGEHGGEITLKSEVGRGTEFFLRFP